MWKNYFRFCGVLVALALAEKNANAAMDNITMTINTNLSIYYDPSTKATLPIKLTDASRFPVNPMKFISQGSPCSCVSNLKCGCCAGLNLTMIGLNRLTCTNVTVVPEEFAVDFHLLMDNEKVLNSRLTGRNPPPACVPLYLLPTITFCARFFDLHVKDNKFHACIDFETRIAQYPIFILHFNCLRFGGDGVTWVTSQDQGGKPIILANTTETVVYDVVNFEDSEETNLTYLQTSTLAPDEQDSVGTLKIKK